MIERKKKQLAKKIMLKPGLIKQFINMYNQLCPGCKAKCIKNPSIPIDEYCMSCRNKINPILENARDELNA